MCFSLLLFFSCSHFSCCLFSLLVTLSLWLCITFHFLFCPSSTFLHVFVSAFLCLLVHCDLIFVWLLSFHLSLLFFPSACVCVCVFVFLFCFCLVPNICFCFFVVLCLSLRFSALLILLCPSFQLTVLHCSTQQDPNTCQNVARTVARPCTLQHVQTKDLTNLRVPSNLLQEVCNAKAAPAVWSTRRSTCLCLAGEVRINRHRLEASLPPPGLANPDPAVSWCLS